MEIRDMTPEAEAEVAITLKGEEVNMMLALADSLWWHLQAPQSKDFLEAIAEALAAVVGDVDGEDYFTGPSTLI